MRIFRNFRTLRTLLLSVSILLSSYMVPCTAAVGKTYTVENFKSHGPMLESMKDGSGLSD